MPKRILVVEDDEDALKLLTARFKKAGFEVLIATDGITGMTLIRRQPPDLIVLDLLMPAGGGLSILKNIRLSVKTKSTPVIVLTATDNMEYKLQAHALGIDAYLQKPYDADLLIKEAMRLVGVPS